MLADLPKYFDFFLPWAGMEKTQFQSENPADVKTAERMGRLYDSGLSKKSNSKKIIYSNGVKKNVDSITPYITSGYSVAIFKRNHPLSNFPLISLGDMPKDGGNLILSTDEKNKMISNDARSDKFIKRYIGSSEFIRGEERWCL